MQKAFIPLVILALTAIVTIAYLNTHDTGCCDNKGLSDSYLPLPQNLPKGWYAHRTSDTAFFVTTQKDLPDIGATEGYAYGDQVGVSLVTTTLSPQAWVTQQQWLNDTEMIISKNWTEAHGHSLLQIEHHTGASPQLLDYLFIDDRVFTITLYPNKGAGLSIFSELQEKYSADPEFKIISDANARTNCETLIFPPTGQEPTIYVDTSTGIVTVGYVTQANEHKTALLNYQNDYNYSGCSVDTHELLSHIKEQQDNYPQDIGQLN